MTKMGPFMVLHLLAEPDGIPCAREGFPNPFFAASWSKAHLAIFGAERDHVDDCPPVVAITTTTHDDFREALTVLDTAAETIRFLTFCGFEEEQIRTTVRTSFPEVEDEEFDVLHAEAIVQLAKSEAELDAALVREAGNAVAAEHDLSESMHR